MKKIFRLCLLLSIFIFSQLAYANVTQNTKFWTALKLNGLFAQDSKWAYLTEMHARFGTNNPSFDQGLIRLGLGYYVIPKGSLWLGYVYSATNDDTTEQEHRLWQQLTWTIINNNQLKLSSRNRLEQRKNFNNSQIAWRFRESILLRFPNLFRNKITPVIGDEVFFNLNNPGWITNKAIDQNRYGSYFSFNP